MEDTEHRSNAPHSNPNATHTILLLAIVILILGLPWLLSGSGPLSDLQPDSILGGAAEDSDSSSLGFLLSPQLLMMISPLILILAVRFLATDTAASWMGFQPDASTIHSVSGSSVGVAALLLLVLAMVILQSFLHGGNLF